MARLIWSARVGSFVALPFLLLAGKFVMFVEPAAPREIQVYAAASLSDALTEIGREYESKQKDRIVFNFGASSTLSRQMEEGAPADIFLSADEAKMDRLEKKDLILKGTRKDILSNTLVIVVPSDSNLKLQSPKQLTELNGRIAIAEPQSVPAGIYAREYLEALGIWEKLEERLVPTENVRAALAAVESGNVEFGIVYKTDAGISKKVKIAFEVPQGEGPQIRYVIAILKSASDPVAAQRFVDYLRSDNGMSIFRKYGFIPLSR
jgi:molybdate transport system substrate-binding protein